MHSSQIRLIGVNPDGPNPGEGEIDILDGGRRPDTLVLGDSDKAYYVGQGLRDYAIIRGFRNQDTIQLNEEFDYELDNTLTLGTEPGTGIFLEGTEEMIAFVEDVTDLSLDSDVFDFV